MLIGEILSSRYNIPPEEIEKALAIQLQVGGYIGQILIQQGIITDAQLVGVLSEQLGLPVLDKDNYAWNYETMLPLLNGGLDLDFTVKNRFIPIEFDADSGTITFASNDPLNRTVEEYVLKTTDYKIKTVLVTENVAKDLSRFYVAERGSNFISLHVDDSPEKLKEMAFEAPVIKFLNTLLSRAVELNVTDVHIEPMGNTYRIRFRIDGILHDMEFLEESFYLAVLSRIKLLSGLDISEKRLPQDGKFVTKIASMLLDIRVSTIPMVKDESVVMRLLYREQLTFDIVGLGSERDHADVIQQLITRPYGVLLVTGPTGSGKTTTLYSMLTRLNSKERKIVTVEDPVEYQLEGINQIQVKTDIGLTFASSLRSILRHDPDIIMIGEIRDRETAEIAIHSALTGHLVLSTLHTNDSPSSLFRLMEMGLESYLLNASIIGVVAQRIIRKNCKNCSERVYLPDEVMKKFSLQRIHASYSSLFSDGMIFLRGSGCPLCAGTGYKGRIAIFECFEYTDHLKEIFVESHALEIMQKTLVGNYGFRTLREDGMIKVMKGLTTIEEVLRVT